MSQTPYGSPDPPKTPYGNQSPVDWAHRAGKCPQCGSAKTHRDFYESPVAAEPTTTREKVADGCLDYGCSGCLDGCLTGCEPLWWPMLVVLALWALLAHLFSRKKRDCTCLDCGHQWKSLTPNKK